MYPFASVYEQERKLYTFHQNDLTNDQWYEKFITRSDVAKSIGLTKQHRVLLENMSQEKHSDSFEKIIGEEKKIVRVDAEERYLYYVLLYQSGRHHVKLKSDIYNDYTTGDERYLETRKNNLHILIHYTKPTIYRNSESQEKIFAQRTGDGRNLQTYEKSYRKDKSATTVTKKAIHILIVQTRIKFQVQQRK